MGKSRDIADGTRYVDASGDTFLGDLTGGTPSTAGASVRFSNNTDSNEKWAMYGWGDEFQISKRDANWGWAGTYLAVDTSGSVLTPNQPAFHVSGHGQSKPSGWQKIITYGSVHLNRGSGFSAANQRFTAPIAGMYLFNTAGYIPANNSTERYAFAIYHNGVGASYIGGGTQASIDAPLTVFSQLINMNANDYVEVFMYTPNTETLGALYHPMWFQGYLVG